MNTANTLRELVCAGDIRRAAVACGVFDGVHRGHRELIRALLTYADKHDATPIVMTFDPHPRAVLQPEQAPRLLTVREQKARLLHSLGVDGCVFLPFSRAMAEMTPEDFLQDHLFMADVALCTICVGPDWRFGRAGAGETRLLTTIAKKHGCNVVVVPQFKLYGEPVSSTRIRDALAAGRLEHAERLLGRPYSVYGHVIRGKGLGGTVLHCPTANVCDARILLPPSGVYTANGILHDQEQRVMRGIAYVGTAPTITDDVSQPLPRVELHLFGYHGDLYGQAVEVEFLAFQRPDQRFETVDALREQLHRDIAEARRR